jgi:hypothetical protein
MIERQKPGIGAYFRLFMATLFIFGSIGIMLGFADTEVPFLAEHHMLVGIPFLLYGLLRFYMAVRMMQGKNDTLNS